MKKIVNNKDEKQTLFDVVVDYTYTLFQALGFAASLVEERCVSNKRARTNFF